MATRKKLIVGNWKMYPRSLKEAKKIFSDFKKKRHLNKNITTVFCPPFVYINELSKSYTGKKIFFGGQNVFWKEEGAFTGQISTQMLKEVGARFVIVGHSEARAQGDNNEMVAQKAKAALVSDMHTIVCIGEPERDIHGHHLKFIDEQLRESLRGIGRNFVKKLVIAYEPIWAIGKGKKAMTPHEIHQMSLYLKKKLIENFGKTIGEKIPILYGGSVNSDNSSAIVYEGHVDGLLVGRASLNPHEFSDLIDAVARKK
jgi:triosephosphate isomerase